MEISRRGTVDPFLAMEVLDAAAARVAAGADVVRMEVGQPAAPAPRAALAAAERALRDGGGLGYTPALGLPALREAIAARYRRVNGVDLSPERVAVTAGASGAFLLALLALFEPGERVAFAEPGYPAYRAMLRALSLEAAPLRAGPETKFQPDARLLADAGRHGRLKGVIAASPANPTGTVLDRDALTDLVEECQRIGAAFISDEIYHGLVFEGRAVSALEVSDQVVAIGSFSKYFRMTGWRVGWMVAPPAVIAAAERLAQNLFICAPALGQVAALAALGAEAELELEGDVAAYAASRDALMEALPRLGFRVPAPPEGAFYLYADAGALTNDSRAFCKRMLEEAGVAATPGADFDPERGATWVRFSFAAPEARIAEGARRLRDWLGERKA